MKDVSRKYKDLSLKNTKTIKNIIIMAFNNDISWEIVASLLNDFSSTLIKSKKVINVLLDYLKILNKKVNDQSIVSENFDVNETLDDNPKNADDIVESKLQGKYNPYDSSMSCSNEKVNINDISDINEDERDLEDDILEAVRNMDANNEFTKSDADNFEIDCSGSDEKSDQNSGTQLEMIESDNAQNESMEQDAFDKQNAEDSIAIEIQKDSKETFISQDRDDFIVNSDPLVTDVDMTEKQFQCKTCAKCFRQKHSLKIHERIHTGEKLYSCKDCSKSFIDNSRLSDHRRIHMDNMPFQCKTCAKCFRKKQSWQRHQRVHTGEKPFQCKNCKEVFTHESNMKRHEKIHLSEKPFKCENCPRSFVRMDHLTLHIRIHNNDKPFPCRMCPKRLASASHLKIHENLHSGEKPYQCKICARCFAHSNSLKAHERTHTGEKPYGCPTCDRHFADLGTMTRHKKLHRKGRPYQCNNCNLFFEMDTFAEHVKKSDRCANEVIPKIGLIH